ncbi:unnamed protein product (macronuclear) [Paramecium tetraurelia]|uniref:Uncharacterized protein n=1 Tax=Paramecium tetraurelia TaxID=5888 RepID=A0D5R2_PARTE|nr:uncharacterized protein GSPATT00013809001 [Paramecium tetraurelia]CAK78379.1 unnamed protein product [Paramecium tetraurelia]|eukprot:XP_001445776.1 hypothetical protein (macronuclear) [Paramecium tetraurelia strain d4-2]
MSNSQLYKPNDLIEFENHKRYSSVGKMLDSMKQTAPAYGFGTSTRYQAQSIYRDKKLLHKGKSSPGPCYNSSNYIKELLARNTTVKIGTAKRNNLNQTQYDYYTRQDSDFEPHKANDFRKMNSTIVKIGLAQRFKTDYKNQVPGPDQYDNLIKKTGPQYSVVPKRPISKSFQGSTPDLIGPGAYDVNKSLDITHESYPSIGFTKGEKMKGIKSVERNQTYYTKGSIGVQIKSNCVTKPCFTIGKESRDIKPGIFKRDMDGVSTKIKISMPKF